MKAYLSPYQKIFICAVLFFLLIGCGEEKTLPTLKASIDFAKTIENGNSSIKYDNKTGANVVLYYDFGLFNGPDMKVFGPVDEVPIADHFVPASATKGYLSLGTGLEYINKGGKYQDGSGTVKLNYLELPIDLNYHYPAGPGKIYGGLGPFFAYGIAGASFGENNGFKRFDADLNFMLGYKLDAGVSLDLVYDPGLANVEYASQDVKGHTRTLGINLGYQLGKLFAAKSK